MIQSERIRVLVTGATGRVGREVLAAVIRESDMELVGAVDPQGAGTGVGALLPNSSADMVVSADLWQTIAATRPHVMVDFTTPAVVVDNIRIAIEAGVCPVVGTTGIPETRIDEIRQLADDKKVGVLIAPNFAIGAVLMMEFAVKAAQYLPDVEIIELHHERKLDAPSGTALLTARKIVEAREAAAVGDDEPGSPESDQAVARGENYRGIRIHSVRLPGFVAHQEVIFGGLGQILTIRHDSTDRRSFMPGILLAIRKVRSLTGLVIGLEYIL